MYMYVKFTFKSKSGVYIKIWPTVYDSVRYKGSVNALKINN